jgi:hypothetical protein
VSTPSRGQVDAVVPPVRLRQVRFQRLVERHRVGSPPRASNLHPHPMGAQRL